MKFSCYFNIFLLFIFLLTTQHAQCSQLSNVPQKYEAIVRGKITKSKVIKHGRFYITEYELRTKDWLYKKPTVQKKKYLTIKILGANFPDKGITIKSSVAPDYVPIKSEAIFLLEKTKSKTEDTFTLSKGGVIYKTSL